MEQTAMFEEDSASAEHAGGTKKAASKKTQNVTVVGDEGPGRPLQGWVQMERIAADFMWKVGVKNATALPLLMYMVAKVKRGSGGVMVSINTIADDLQCTTRTVQKAINVLKNSNFIQVLKSGNSNVYILNSQVAWSGKRGARTATFHATIKVVEQEQDVAVDQLIEEGKALLPVPEMFGSGDLNWDMIEGDMREVEGGEGQLENDAQPTAQQ